VVVVVGWGGLKSKHVFLCEKWEGMGKDTK